MNFANECGMNGKSNAPRPARGIHPALLALWISLLAPGIVCGQTPPFTQAPPIGADTSAGVLIIVTDTGILVKTDPSQGPYDGDDDTLVGVLNESRQTLFSLPLSSPNPIFGFDGDGIYAQDSNGNFIYNPPIGGPYGPTGYEGPGVRFSSINSTQTAGIVQFPAGIGPGQAAYFALEEAITTMCTPIPNVPLFKQGGVSAPWAKDTYDDEAPDTISKYGCALTCCAMLINYQAAVQFVNFSTDPGTLNDWLTDNDGYDTSGGVKWGTVAEYARANRVRLYYQGRINTSDDFVVDNYLCANDPVILKVPHGKGHFVLATGETTISGTDTYIINDPGFNNSTLAGYNFKYLGIRKFSASPSPPNALLITGHSPVELLITDPSGHRVGTNSNNSQSFLEIPDGGYSVEALGDDEDPSGTTNLPETKVLDIPNAANGVYNLQVFGTGSGPYTLEFTAYDSNGEPTTTFLNGTASPGLETDYSLTYSSAPGAQLTFNQASAVLISPPQSFSGVKPTITYRWQALPSVTSYTLTINNGGAGSSILWKRLVVHPPVNNPNAATISVTVPGHVLNASYNWSVVPTMVSQIQPTLLKANALQLHMAATSGVAYSLQVATNLTPPVYWQTIATKEADTNGNWSYTDSNLPPSTTRYYRVKAP